MNREIISSVESEYRRYKALGEAAIDQLAAADLAAASPGQNSIVTLVWHVSGNLESRFTDFLDSDGEKDWRDRESEFAERRVDEAELLAKWEDGWGALLGTLASLTDDHLMASVTIRGVSLTVHEALHRSLAHTCYHVGQIVFRSRTLRGSDWKFLSIPPGGSEAYNRRPAFEEASDHAASAKRRSQ